MMRLPGTKTVCVPEDAARAFEQATHPIMVVCPCGADFGTPNAHGESWCSAGCGFYVTDATEARRGTAIPMEEVSE